MEKLLMIYKALVVLGPIARKGMEYAQALIPEKGQGLIRQAIVKAHLAQAFAELKIAVIKFEDVWPRLESDINEAVPVLKGLGILKSADVVTAALAGVDKVVATVEGVAGAPAAAAT